jgi:hypothetical protein
LSAEADGLGFLLWCHRDVRQGMKNAAARDVRERAASLTEIYAGSVAAMVGGIETVGGGRDLPIRKTVNSLAVGGACSLRWLVLVPSLRPRRVV